MKKNIIIFTGPGKGKTSAALGIAIRACGQGKKVCIIQFIKNSKSTGEYKFLHRKKDIEIHLSGCGFIRSTEPKQKHIKSAQSALQLSIKKILSRKYFLVILDEILYALHYNLIPTDPVLNLIKQIPDNVNLILTGRHAAKSIISKANLVTEMKEVKHPFRRGIKAIKGIDF